MCTKLPVLPVVGTPRLVGDGRADLTVGTVIRGLGVRRHLHRPALKCSARRAIAAGLCLWRGGRLSTCAPAWGPWGAPVAKHAAPAS